MRKAQTLKRMRKAQTLKYILYYYELYIFWELKVKACNYCIFPPYIRKQDSHLKSGPFCTSLGGGGQTHPVPS